MLLVPQQAWRWEQDGRYGFVLNMSGSTPGEIYIAILGYSTGLAAMGHTESDAVNKLLASLDD